MYILKIKPISGKSDYVQIRDDNFTLISYFRFENLHRALVKANLSGFEETIKKVIEKAKYGTMERLEDSSD